MSEDYPTLLAKDELERGAVLAPRFDADGLIAAVATHADTGEVLMLAWMNAEALRRTLDTREAHYFSHTASWSQSILTSSTVCTCPEVSPFLHSAWRERLK